MDSLFPNLLHTSSHMCGANGDNKTVRVLIISALLHFKEVSSLTHIMNALTDVLKEKLLISSSTFFIVLCNIFKLSLLGFS